MPKDVLKKYSTEDQLLYQKFSKLDAKERKLLDDLFSDCPCCVYNEYTKPRYLRMLKIEKEIKEKTS